jgi:DMSO/TMAO reductase YedYZ molybdopterin-dependent catalytic subunit
MSAQRDEETLVEKRQRYIEKRRKADPTTVDVRFDGMAPVGSGPTNRHGMPALPVGQHLVQTWPVLDLGDLPDVSREAWRLEIAGLVENPVTLDFDALLALPQIEDVSDFHCVTTWSRLGNRWKGVRFSSLCELVVPADDARFVFATGYDVAPGTDVPYTTNLPLARALDPDVLLVYEWEGAPLPREHGGPVRMITPRLYAWKGAKWIRRVELLAEDRLGFWEERGYSNSAEPWFNDRFSGEPA